MRQDGDCQDERAKPDVSLVIMVEVDGSRHDTIRVVSEGPPLMPLCLLSLGKLLQSYNDELKDGVYTVRTRMLDSEGVCDVTGPDSVSAGLIKLRLEADLIHLALSLEDVLDSLARPPETLIEDGTVLLAHAVCRQMQDDPALKIPPDFGSFLVGCPEHEADVRFAVSLFGELAQFGVSSDEVDILALTNDGKLKIDRFTTFVAGVSSDHPYQEFHNDQLQGQLDGLLSQIRLRTAELLCAMFDQAYENISASREKVKRLREELNPTG